MNTYEVTISLTCTYTIDAPTQEVAEDIAYEYFLEANPDIEAVQIQTE